MPRIAPPTSTIARRWAAALGAAALLALAAGPARADDYDPKRAGHPLRVAAYVVHPVGVVLDWLLFRPAHAIGSVQPFAYLFGHERHPHEYAPDPDPAPDRS